MPELELLPVMVGDARGVVEVSPPGLLAGDVAQGGYRSIQLARPSLTASSMSTTTSPMLAGSRPSSPPEARCSRVCCRVGRFWGSC